MTNSRTLCALGFALASLSLGAALAGQDAERPLVPKDTLPTPLVREAPLGVESLKDGFSASDAEVALGRRLFFDPDLSARRTVACASCHRPDLGFADDRPMSRGIEGYLTRRNAPSLFNKGLATNVLWDGRAATLEDQVIMPIENPEEMGLGIAAAVNRLSSDEGYTEEFRQVYGREIDAEGIASALAAFVRALVVGDSPVDRFQAGDVSALGPDEEAGLWIFEGKGRCWQCHSDVTYADNSFHNTGIGAKDGKPHPGRGKITEKAGDDGKFRTPGLRMLTKTAPYMHDGSMATLEEVVAFYRKGGNANSNLSDKLRPLSLTDREAKQLVAFLKALSR